MAGCTYSHSAKDLPDHSSDSSTGCAQTGRASCRATVLQQMALPASNGKPTRAHEPHLYVFIKGLPVDLLEEAEADALGRNAHSQALCCSDTLLPHLIPPAQQQAWSQFCRPRNQEKSRCNSICCLLSMLHKSTEGHQAIKYIPFVATSNASKAAADLVAR